MKNYKLMVVLLPFLLLTGVSCNKDTAKNDADTADPDGDIPSIDDIEIGDDSTLLSDDGVSDKDTVCPVTHPENEYIPNTHTGNEDCPTLKTSNFPYYDTNGSIHFCRKCDKVWKNDPQCSANLWIEENARFSKLHPDGDCCGYPCQIKGMAPMKQDNIYNAPMDYCDIADPVGWNDQTNQFKHHALNNKKIGLTLYTPKYEFNQYPTVSGAFELDIAAQTYTKILPMHGATIAYYDGALLATTGDFRVPGANMTIEYLSYVSKSGKIEMIYPSFIEGVSYEPVLNDRWVLANLTVSQTDGRKIRYAKVGEWQWRAIEGDGTAAYAPQLNGDRLAFLSENYKGYICDLASLPSNVSQCILINRDAEQVRYPTMHEDNPDRVFFQSLNYAGIMEVDISKTPFVYTEHPVYLMSDQHDIMAVGPSRIRGDLMLYSIAFYTTTTLDETDVRACYYRLDTKKSYCVGEVDFSAIPGINLKYNQAAVDFEKHYLTWQGYAYSTYVYTRDMECYCDRHPELCPFDDYTPQPDNPKEPFSGIRMSKRK